MKLGVDYAWRWAVALRQRPREALRCLPGALRDYLPWRASLAPGRSPLGDEQPWITFAARRALDRLLRPSSSVFEYGSGGSTLYLARRARSVVSIEHDPAWLEAVRARLARAGLCHVELVCAPPEPGDGADPADPLGYASSSPPCAGLTFRAYVGAIDAYPDEAFDLVLVDGRARPSCLAHAWRKVKLGGHLVLDDSVRPHYEPAACRLAAWRRVDTYGPAPYGREFHRTTLWRRPPSRWADRLDGWR